MSLRWGRVGAGAAAVAAVVAVVACGQSLDSLGEFPCARDGTCPAGWVCGGARCIQEQKCGPGGSCTDGLVCLSGDTCLPDLSCRVGEKDCTSPGRPKCTLTSTTETEASVQCVPSEGAVQEAQPCTWSKSATFVAGRDNCAAGLFCSNALVSPKVPSATSPMCVALCDEPSDCGEGVCMLISDVGVGACVQTCGIGTCGAGRDCKWREEAGTGNYRGTCMKYGTKGPGGIVESACTTASECAQGYDCWNIGTEQGFYCHRSCDLSHPCPDGDRCITDDRFLNGAGACGCRLFQDGECGAGRTCRIWGTSGKAFFTGCSRDGQLGLGANCNAGACAAGLVCWSQDGASQYYCRKLCDDVHACPADSVCRAQQPNLQNGAGVCL